MCQQNSEVEDAIDSAGVRGFAHTGDMFHHSFVEQ